MAADPPMTTEAQRAASFALPVVLSTTMPVLGGVTWGWMWLVVAAGGSYGAGFFLAWLILAMARRALRPETGGGVALFFDAARRPLRILLGAVLFRESVVRIGLAPEISAAIDHVTFALIVFTLAWFSIQAVGSSVGWASTHLPEEPEHEIRHRVVRTQLTLLRQSSSAVILLVAAGATLMQFTVVRSVGLSLFASAGVVGVIVGFAAQKPLGALIGGLQLSLTQPIRIGDTVFIERELGTIAKIHLTYVVVRLREQRMLVVPVSRFLDAPFENWTLAAPDVIGAVLISADFTTPVDAVRSALTDACLEHEAWDHKTCSLEVTETNERTMTLRALVSSSDAAGNWALRCHVRERLVSFLSHLDGGRHLPHDRASSLGEEGRKETVETSTLPAAEVFRARAAIPPIS